MHGWYISSGMCVCVGGYYVDTRGVGGCGEGTGIDYGFDKRERNRAQVNKTKAMPRPVTAILPLILIPPSPILSLAPSLSFFSHTHTPLSPPMILSVSVMSKSQNSKWQHRAGKESWSDYSEEHGTAPVLVSSRICTHAFYSTDASHTCRMAVGVTPIMP